MALINPQSSARGGPIQFGFKTSIITLFVAIVLFIGLTLVYLSFSRIAAITDSAASKFMGEVAELSADRIGSQLKLVRDSLKILNALPPIQSADIEENPRLNALLAAMLKSNDQLFNLYVGYEDGSFIEMDTLDGAGRDTRARLEAPEQAAFRLLVISRSDPARIKSRRLFLSEKLETVRELPGPLDYDPRERPWYNDAARRDGSWLTGPYVFFATQKQGYTIQLPIEQGKGGVIAGDLLLDVTQELLKREQLTPSAVAFLFDDDDRILAHPRMSEMLGREVSGDNSPPSRDGHGRCAQGDSSLESRRAFRTTISRLGRPALCRGLSSHCPFRSGQPPRGSGGAGGRVFRQHPFCAARGCSWQHLPSSDSWFRSSISWGRFYPGRSGRWPRKPTEFKDLQPAAAPGALMIREIDELGRSVATMRSVTETFSQFVPRRLVESLVETGTPMAFGGAGVRSHCYSPMS